MTPADCPQRRHRLALACLAGLSLCPAGCFSDLDHLNRMRPAAQALEVATGTGARDSDYVKRLHRHETRLQADRVDYEAELQEARRQQDDNAAHQHR